MLQDAMGLAGCPISDSDFMRYINLGMRDLEKFDTAKVRDTQVINCTDASLWYAMDHAIGFKKVVDSNGFYYPYFSLDNNQIQFAHTGSFTLHFWIPNTKITAMTGTLTIDSSYEMTLSKYAAYMAKKDPDLFQDYLNDAILTNKNLRGNVNKNRKVYVRPFR
jgi:hypothetical protein